MNTTSNVTQGDGNNVQPHHASHVDGIGQSSLQLSFDLKNAVIKSTLGATDVGNKE
jgi:hypothetical protein